MIKVDHALKGLMAIAMLAMLVFPLPWQDYPTETEHKNSLQK